MDLVILHFCCGDGLPEHFVALPVIRIQFMPEILPIFGLSHRVSFELSCAAAYTSKMQGRFGLVLKACLVCYFLCSNSIFYIPVPPSDCIFTIIHHAVVFGPEPRATHEAADALNSCHQGGSGAFPHLFHVLL